MLWTVGSIVGLLSILILLGYIFEDKIHLMAIKELEKALNADIEVRETSVSFLRSWPSVQVKLKDLRINPKEKQSPEDVLSAEALSLNISFWSIFTSNYKISQVKLVSPEFNLIRDKKGNWNYADMFVVESDSTKPKSEEEMVFELKAVRIEDGKFNYKDLGDGSLVRIDSIQMDMDGDFSADRSDIETEFGLHLQEWRVGKAEWAKNKHLSADILTDVTFGENEHYSLKEAQVKIAALVLDLKGEIGRKGEVFDLNLSYGSNQSSFESFLSLLPGGLLDTGREYEYDGQFLVRGWLKGKAGGKYSPDVHADYQVTQGAFHYVGYESRLTDVNLGGEFELLQKDPSGSHFTVKDFKAKLHDRLVTGEMNYVNFDDPKLGLALKGDLSLQDVRDFYPPFADSTELEGIVGLDLQIEGKIADFKEKKHGEIKAFGGATFESLRVNDPRLAMPIENLSGKILLDNHRIEIPKLAGKAGSSDFDLKGSVSEYLPWFFEEGAVIKGQAELKSANINLNEWLQAETVQVANQSTEQSKYTYVLPENMDFRVVAQAGKFKLDNFEATAMNGVFRLNGNTLSIEQLYMNTLSGRGEVQGKLVVANPSRVDVDIDTRIRDVDINLMFKTFEQLAAFALVKDNLFGIFSGDVKIQGSVNEFMELESKSFVSFGNVNFRECKLINFEPLKGLAGFVKLEDLEHVEFSDITTDYRIADEYFYIPKMSVTANRYKMDIVGKHGFDNSLDYKVYVEMPRNEARKSKNKQVLDMVEVNEGDPLRIIIPVHVTGTVDKPKYGLEGDFVAEKFEQQIKKQGQDLKQAWNTEVQETWGKKDTNHVEEMIEVQHDPSDTNKVQVGKVLDKVKKPLDKLKKPFKSVGDAFR